MKLREKTIIVLVSMLALIGVSMYAALRIFYDRSVLAVERGEAEDAVRRLELLIEEDLRQLDILCRDWAYWDDSYSFASGGAADFVAGNLTGDTVDQLELSILEIRDVTGRTLFSSQDGPGLSADLMSALRSWDGSRPTEGYSGPIVIGGEVHLVAGRMILRSDASGPANGSIVMARRIGTERLARYGLISGRTVEIRPARLDERLADDGRVRLERGGASSRASLSLPGIDGGLPIMITIESPSVSVRYGTSRLVTVSVILLGTMAVSGLLTIVVLENILLGRMRTVGRELERLAATEDPKVRITVPGSDELAILCRTMNRSLDRLDGMIDEREALLHEIHHRVKNNLQVVSSLLSLQGSMAASAETEQAFERTRLRLQAIASIHDMALRHPTIDRIDMIPLLKLAVSSMASIPGSGKDLSYAFEGETVAVGIDMAHPVVLIAAEIVHNAITHAFQDMSAGTITLAVSAGGIRAGGRSELILEIRDNGVGIGDRTPRLGLFLVEALCQQLHGRFELGRGNDGGTVFRLEAPMPS